MDFSSLLLLFRARAGASGTQESMAERVCVRNCEDFLHSVTLHTCSCQLVAASGVPSSQALLAAGGNSRSAEPQ